MAILTARLAAEELMREAHEAALRVLGLALETRDGETVGHIDRVTTLTLRVGRSMGLQEDELQALRWGAYLHDVGKLAVPDAVLLKPGKLDDREWTIMRSHVQKGERFAGALGFLPQDALSVIVGHHERWDGGGYPQGLQGDYKTAWTQAAALAEIQAQAGRQFEPVVVQHFLGVMAQEAQVHDGSLSAPLV